MILARRTRTVTIALAVAGLVGALNATPAAAAHGHTASARAHVTKTIVTSVRASVAVTASATAGSPGVRAQATVRIWATGQGRATRSAWARATRTAGTRAGARRAARAAARAQ